MLLLVLLFLVLVVAVVIALIVAAIHLLPIIWIIVCVIGVTTWAIIPKHRRR